MTGFLIGAEKLSELSTEYAQYRGKVAALTSLAIDRIERGNPQGAVELLELLTSAERPAAKVRIAE